MIASHVITGAHGSAGVKASKAAQALMAMFLGAFVVGICGFSQIGVIHNAAHDTRHSSAFPCH